MSSSIFKQAIKSARGLNRRDFCGAAAAAAAASPFGLSGFPYSPRSTAMNANVQTKGSDSTALRPFHVSVPEAQLIALRKRISATQWPERETVADQSQGPQLATVQKLARYWQTEYDWRKVEARLNALPNFITGSTVSTFTSFTFVRNIRARCLSSSRTAGPGRSSSS